MVCVSHSRYIYYYRANHNPNNCLHTNPFPQPLPDCLRRDEPAATVHVAVFARIIKSVWISNSFRVVYTEENLVQTIPPYAALGVSIDKMTWNRNIQLVRWEHTHTHTHTHTQNFPIHSLAWLAKSPITDHCIWPWSDGKLWRGGGFNDAYRNFFIPNTKYRFHPDTPCLTYGESLLMLPCSIIIGTDTRSLKSTPPMITVQFW